MSVQHRRRVAAVASLVLALATLGAGLAPSPAAAAVSGKGSGKGVFSHPLAVNNPWFPLSPGMEFTYRGTLREGGQSHPHTVTFTVSDYYKVIGGVRTVVAWDRDFLDGELAEQELAFFAQDDQGNVWNFGEYPEEYDAGKLTGAPSTWIRGSGDAYGGIHVLGQPHVGSNWTEGRVPSIDFWDVSRIVAVSASTCEPVRCFHPVVVVNEGSPNVSTSGTQVKYYARGTGLVRVAAVGGDAQETLQLVSVRKLSSSRMAVIDRAVRRMDQRGYTVAAKVYKAAPPVVRR